MSRTQVPEKPFFVGQISREPRIFGAALDRMIFFGSVEPYAQISGFPRSVRAKVVTYQGMRRFSEPVGAACRSSARLPKSQRNISAAQIFGACRCCSGATRVLDTGPGAIDEKVVKYKQCGDLLRSCRAVVFPGQI